MRGREGQRVKESETKGKREKSLCVGWEGGRQGVKSKTRYFHPSIHLAVPYFVLSTVDTTVTYRHADTAERSSNGPEGCSRHCHEVWNSQPPANR